MNEPPCSGEIPVLRRIKVGLAHGRRPVFDFPAQAQKPQGTLWSVPCVVVFIPVSSVG
jgi:hypothetical protein